MPLYIYKIFCKKFEKNIYICTFYIFIKYQLFEKKKNYKNI